MSFILIPLKELRFFFLEWIDKGLGSLHVKERFPFWSNYLAISEKHPKCGDTRADGS